LSGLVVPPRFQSRMWSSSDWVAGRWQPGSTQCRSRAVTRWVRSVGGSVGVAAVVQELPVGVGE
jgi:hypothetical protein